MRWNFLLPVLLFSVDCAFGWEIIAEKFNTTTGDGGKQLDNYSYHQGGFSFINLKKKKSLVFIRYEGFLSFTIIL